MTLLIPILIFVVIMAIMVALAIYDCRHYILPDELNAALGVMFLLFHAVTHWSFLSPLDAALGAAVGGGLLLLIRQVANRYYAEDALGLGDVKLMTAAGLGLGFPDILAALSCGAGLGLLHGLVLGFMQQRKGKTVDFGKVNVPAGLGLCGGVTLLMIVRFGPAVINLING